VLSFPLLSTFTSHTLPQRRVFNSPPRRAIHESPRQAPPKPLRVAAHKPLRVAPHKPLRQAPQSPPRWDSPGTLCRATHRSLRLRLRLILLAKLPMIFHAKLPTRRRA